MAGMPYLLVYPMFAMVLLTVIVGLVMFRIRIQAVRAGSLDVRYFKTYNVGSPPEAVIQSGRHFTNLFEVPVLFYVACMTAMMIGIENAATVPLAWVFVVSRLAHAWVHLGSNKMFLRMAAFLVGMAAVLALWIVIVIHVAALN